MAVVRLLILTFLLPSAAGAAPGSPRLWSFTSGEKLTARLMWADRESLYLRDSAGKDLVKPVGLLTNADLEHVRELRDKLRAEGILYEASLTWESYHSKNLRSLDAEKAGAYPLSSRENALGQLEIEFERFGPVPALGARTQAVLRLTTAKRTDAGTNSAVQVVYQRQLAGSASGARPGSHFDIPLSPAVFSGSSPITLTLTCGPDTIHVRTGKSGAGARLLIVEQKPE